MPDGSPTLSKRAAPKGVRTRQRVTHGELYRLLSAEFRALRGMGCCYSTMPLVFERWSSAAGESNWAVEPLRSRCPDCASVVRRIVEKHAALYDLKTVHVDDFSAGAELSPPTIPFCL